MNKITEPIKIKIESNWLQSGYFVYAAIIIYKNKKFMYIGQTGDNNHLSARGPLFRISGHFDKTLSSDQNQIIKGFREKILNNKSDKALLEKALTEAEIKYTFWKISKFDYSQKKDEHVWKAQQTQVVEHWLIYHLQNKVTLFNKSVKNEISDSKNKKYKELKIENLKILAKNILSELGYE